MPEPRPAGSDAEDGRGLHFVARLAATAEAAGELEIATAFAPIEGERRLLLSRLLDVRPEPA